MIKNVVVIFLLFVSPLLSYAQDVYFSDDFEQGITDSWDLESGWRPHDEHGNSVLIGEGHTWARVKAQDWRAYGLVSRFKLLRGGLHTNFYVSEVNGRYFVGCREGVLYLQKEFPWGTFQMLSEVPTDIQLNRWHTLTLNLNKGYLQVDLDGNTILTFQDNDPLTHGTVAFETLEGSLAQIDDVRVFPASEDVRVNEVHIIEGDFDTVFAMKEISQEFAVGDAAQERFSLAEDALNHAFQLWEEGAQTEAQQAVEEAAILYRETVIAGIEGVLFEPIRRSIESGEAEVTEEQLESAIDQFRQAQHGAFSHMEFIGLIKELKKDLIADKAKPNLTLELWSDPFGQMKWISPYPPVNDQMTTVSAVVKNTGLVPVEKSFKTALYVDNNLVKTWTFSLAETENNPLMKGQSLVRDYSATFSEGKHSFRWVVDVNDDISESDESKKNNEVTAQENWISKSNLPDLVVEKITHKEPLVTGSQITWNITIRNQGNTDVNVPFLTTLSADGVQFGTFWLNKLKKHDAKTFSTKQYAGYAGTETITGIVDVGNVVVESSENNNKKFETFTTSYVDLEVMSGSLVKIPHNPTVYEPITLSFSIRNKGSGTADKPFHVKVYPGKVVPGKKPGTKVTQPYLIPVTKDQLPLTKNQTINLKHTVTLVYKGEYDIWITADPNSVYKEKNTINNTLADKIKVKIPTVKISKVEPVSSCKDEFYVYLDRSPGYWQGNVVLKIYYKGKAIRTKALAANKSKAFFKIAGYFSSFIEKPYNVKTTLVAYAKVGNELIKSAGPEEMITVRVSTNSVIKFINPPYANPGQKVDVTILGKNIATPENKTQLKVGFGKPQEVPAVGSFTTDTKIKVTPKSVSPSKIIAEFDIATDAKKGTRVVEAIGCWNNHNWYPFYIGVKPPASKLPDLFLHQVWIEPSTFPSPNTAFTFYFTGGNASKFETPKTEVKLVLNTGASKIIKVPKLKPWKGFKGYWKFPNGLAEGSYSIDVYLDYKNKVIEGNENNNYNHMGFSVW